MDLFSFVEGDPFQKALYPGPDLDTLYGSDRADVVTVYFDIVGGHFFHLDDRIFHCRFFAGVEKERSREQEERDQSDLFHMRRKALLVFGMFLYV